ncbi:MAG: transcriptional repressor [Chloroflexi bacterium]|nr:MAG: transcriptional repressor [Chloroflexota bacterium]MBL1195362.1 transcriptional repressor [Chloroflexota bacterium]NOH12646.1 transcriptional repressor [Chloroflexota bacterium]
MNPYLEERIRELGFRITPQRQLILEAVAEAGEKARIEDIMERVQAKSSAISQATVYRTLEIFGAHNLIHVNVLDGQRVYEVAGENVHHHMICQSCWSDEKIPHKVVNEFVDNVQVKYGFLAQPHHLFLLGLCKHCQEEEDKKQISKEEEKRP